MQIDTTMVWKDINYTEYKPDEKELQVANIVKKRIEEMKSARRAIDTNRGIYQQMIEAIFEPYPDERSSSTVPLASSMIELYVSDAIKIQTDFRFRAESAKYKTNAKALKHVWDYDRRINKRRQVFNDAEYIAWAFWTQIMYTGYETCEFIQKDPVMWVSGIEWENRTIKEKNIIIKDMDIRYAYIDNHAIDSIDQASDCAYEQWVSYEKFMVNKSNPFYKNMDSVKPVAFSSNSSTFITEEERWKQGEFVKLQHYWNVEKDWYVLLANDMLVRAHPMMSTINGKKALPISIRVLWKKHYSIYGRGLCEACLMFNSEINNLRELLMDGIRRSNSQVLAIGNWLSFDWRKFSYDNEILTFDWNLAGNFEQLSWNPPNQAIFSYIDRIYKDLAVFTGIDLQNLIGQPQQTAFQTEVQREASQKRINLWLTNRDLAYERIADLHKDNLKRFFPTSTAEGIIPEIEIEGEKFDKANNKFKKAKGTSMFEVTAEQLEWDIYTDVYTNTTAPQINAVAKEQKMEFSRLLPWMLNWFAQAKQMWVDIESIISPTKLITELAEDIGMDIMNTTDKDWLDGKKKEFMQQLMSMKEWLLSKQPQWQSIPWWQPSNVMQWNEQELVA